MTYTEDENIATTVDGYPSTIEVEHAFLSSYDRRPRETDWLMFLENVDSENSIFDGTFVFCRSRSEMFALLKSYPLLFASAVTNEQHRVHFQELAPRIREKLLDAETETVSMGTALNGINKLLAGCDEHIRWWGPAITFARSQHWFAKSVRELYLKLCYEYGEEGDKLRTSITPAELKTYLQYLLHEFLEEYE